MPGGVSGCQSPILRETIQINKKSNGIEGTPRFLNRASLLFLGLIQQSFLISGIFSPKTEAISPGNIVGCRRVEVPTQALCCAGRNSSCKSYEASERVPAPPLPLMNVFPGEQFPGVLNADDEHIGELILPDTVALREPEGAELVTRHLDCCPTNLRVFFAKNQRVKSGDKSEDEWFRFGYKKLEGQALESVVWEGSRPIIRYSTLSKYLPVRISETHRGSLFPTATRPPIRKPRPPQMRGRQTAQQRQTIYVGETSRECFCDQACTQYGDCCADYRSACPARDCRTSGWSSWSPCQPDGGQCGVGKSERYRVILEKPENAGQKCPDLEETRACFVDCPTERLLVTTKNATICISREIRDITTVALLLDYRYNASRSLFLPSRRDNTTNRSTSKPQLHHQRARGRRRPVLKTRRKLYRQKKEHQPQHLKLRRRRRKKRFPPLPPLNSNFPPEQFVKNCVESPWRSQLQTPRIICAECQPEAQYHRPRPRCASDLEDGQTGFWKLIGPPSCNGIWRRLDSAQNCRCPEQFPVLTPFLLV